MTAAAAALLFCAGPAPARAAAAKAPEPAACRVGTARRALARSRGLLDRWEELVTRTLPSDSRDVERQRERYMAHDSARRHARRDRERLEAGALQACRGEPCRSLFEPLLLDCPRVSTAPYGMLIAAYHHCRAVAAGSPEPCSGLPDPEPCVSAWVDARLARAVIGRRPEAMALCLEDAGGIQRNGSRMAPASARELCARLMAESTTAEEFCRLSYGLETRGLPEEGRRPYPEYLDRECRPSFLMTRGDPRACAGFGPEELSRRQICAEIVAYRRASAAGDAGLCGDSGACRAMMTGDPRSCEAYAAGLRSSCGAAPAALEAAPSRLVEEPERLRDMERALESSVRRRDAHMGEARLLGHRIADLLDQAGRSLSCDDGPGGAGGGAARLARELDGARARYRRVMDLRSGPP